MQNQANEIPASRAQRADYKAVVDYLVDRGLISVFIADEEFCKVSLPLILKAVGRPLGMPDKLYADITKFAKQSAKVQAGRLKAFLPAHQKILWLVCNKATVCQVYRTAKDTKWPTFIAVPDMEAYIMGDMGSIVDAAAAAPNRGTHTSLKSRETNRLDTNNATESLIEMMSEFFMACKAERQYYQDLSRSHQCEPNRNRVVAVEEQQGVANSNAGCSKRRARQMGGAVTGKSGRCNVVAGRIDGANDEDIVVVGSDLADVTRQWDNVVQPIRDLEDIYDEKQHAVIAA